MSSEVGEVVLRSSRVVTPAGVRPADVLLAGDRIREVLEHRASQPVSLPVVDLGDDVLIPALVDVHVHINDPPPGPPPGAPPGAGREAWEGFASASRAAVAGGITLLVDMPLNSDPVTTSVEALEAKLRAADGRTLVDVAFYAGVVPANACDGRRLADLALAGVAAFKCFLCDSGLAGFPPIDRSELRAAMTHLAGLGRRLLVHAERFGPPSLPASPPIGRSYAAYLASRPASAELEAIALLIDLARETGCAVHVVHLATAEALPMLEAARAAGVDITVETCPHYLTFAAEEIADGETVKKCAPPIRDAANREALWGGLERGVIDFVATDHSPCPPELKRLDSGDFGAAWGGIASLQLLLPVLWSGARERGFGLERLVEWISGRPARWLGLPDRGAIRAGARADLVAFRPEERFLVRGSALEHRHPQTAYEGRELSGVVQRTWAGGRALFRAGILLPEVTSASPSPVPPPMGAPVRIRGGFTAAGGRAIAALAGLSRVEAEDLLRLCCGSRRWLEAILAGWPYPALRDLFAANERAFDGLDEPEWREAFAAHPRIGDVEALHPRRTLSPAGAALEGSEQAGAAGAAASTLAELAAGNALYESRFGHVFLICATGKSAGEMLAALGDRLANDARTEFALACEEQRKITVLRLEKLRGELELRPS